MTTSSTPRNSECQTLSVTRSTDADGAADGTFVLTSGRAGSTLLARLLHTHRELAVVSDLLEPAERDPYYDRRLVIDGEEFWRLLSRTALPQRVEHWRSGANTDLLFLPERTEDLSLLMAYTLPFLDPTDPWGLHAELGAAVRDRPALPAPDHFLFVCRWVRDRRGATAWIERTGGSLPHAEAIVEAWPDARYIVLSRDPAETALSMTTGSFFRLCLAVEHRNAEGWLEPRYSDPVALAAMVDRWTERAERALAAVPDHQILRLTYERLTEDPVGALTAVVAFALRRPPTSRDRRWASRVAEQVELTRTRLAQLAPDDIDRLVGACRTSRERWLELRETEG